MALTRVPVTILAGFLGSGKTTRLNALLRAPHGRRIAVVLNELGEVGVDAAKLADASEFVELDGGCICCALNADLEVTLERLHARGGFDHLVIETTGIADPLPVAWLLERGGLHDAYRVDAIVVLADAAGVERALDAAPEATLQLERADLVLVTKLDLVPDPAAALAAVAARVHALNPTVRILPAPLDDPPWSLLLDAVPGASARPAAAPAHVHLAAWKTWSFRTAATVSEAALDAFCRTLPADVLRLKGLVRTDGEPAWVEVHAVGGRYEIEPIDVPSPPAESTLLAVGRPLDGAALDARARTLTAG